ncbi:hypothetical protein IAS59_006145 [Cryptococcus gattii]
MSRLKSLGERKSKTEGSKVMSYWSLPLGRADYDESLGHIYVTYTAHSHAQEHSYKPILLPDTNTSEVRAVGSEALGNFKYEEGNIRL